MRTNGEATYTNRLIHEKSPYLLQHAHNPVDWFPWGQEAFEKAARENKPVFLSIGYSTCHWCHVMERESFEDEEVAALMNAHYVAIKVDREERPDVDHIYMSVCQALTGQGGWPLTIIMTPDQKPFYAGTYFPKQSRFGHPGLLDVLEGLASKWESDRAAIEHTGEHVVQHMLGHESGAAAGGIDNAWVDQTYRALASSFDEPYGGFSVSPKFPTPHNLMFLLRYAVLREDRAALNMVEKTLDAMRRGGIYDHVGSGFSRYSTDRKWLVPHFEKMLYDNALLTIAYVEAYQLTGNRAYADTAEDVLTYLMRDMRHPDGAFYSAEDADSEGEEGKFYLWTPSEVKAVLGEDAGGRYCRCFDITDLGNFEGGSIPNLVDQSLDAFAETENISAGDWQKQCRLYNHQLYLHRKQRVHPGKDDKVLLGWNALTIAALVMAGRVLPKRTYIEAAESVVAFIDRYLTDEDGRLYARFRDGERKHKAYAEDYAYYVWALTELYQATYDAEYLARAIAVQDDMDLLFWDHEHGGYHYYGADAESLIARPKEVYDGATPSGNSVAAYNLIRLARLTGNTAYESRAEHLMTRFAGQVQSYPAGYTFFMLAVQYALGQSQEVVLVGRRHSPDVSTAVRMLNSMFLPNVVSIVRDMNGDDQLLIECAPYIADYGMTGNQATLYICQNTVCQAPTTEVESALRGLGRQLH